MNNKKYVIDNIEEKYGRYNPTHEEVSGLVCYPAYLCIGERGWLLYEESYGYWPRVYHLSVVEKVTENENSVIIETKNSIYTLKEVN